MPSDEYSSFGKGALKLKGVGGGKVKKHKKKEKKNSPDLERALATATGEPSSQQPLSADKRRSESLAGHDGDDEDEAPVVSHKTEAERRFEEARRKKFLEMSQSADGRPELLKTHKERVEELNTYLSKLSEHHDMPKIGPG